MPDCRWSASSVSQLSLQATVDRRGDDWHHRAGGSKYYRLKKVKEDQKGGRDMGALQADAIPLAEARRGGAVASDRFIRAHSFSGFTLPDVGILWVLAPAGSQRRILPERVRVTCPTGASTPDIEMRALLNVHILHVYNNYVQADFLRAGEGEPTWFRLAAGGTMRGVH